jgi:hypothetical protein
MGVLALMAEGVHHLFFPFAFWHLLGTSSSSFAASPHIVLSFPPKK